MPALSGEIERSLQGYHWLVCHLLERSKLLSKNKLFIFPAGIKPKLHGIAININYDTVVIHIM